MSTVAQPNVATTTKVVQVRGVSKIFKRDAFQVTARTRRRSWRPLRCVRRAAVTRPEHHAAILAADSRHVADVREALGRGHERSCADAHGARLRVDDVRFRIGA